MDFTSLTITINTPISNKRMIGNRTLTSTLHLGTSISISGQLLIDDFTIAEKLQNSELLTMDLILSNEADGVIVFDFPTLQLLNLSYEYTEDSTIKANIEAEAKYITDILRLSFISAPVLSGANIPTSISKYPLIFEGDIVGTTDRDRYRIILNKDLRINAIIYNISGSDNAGRLTVAIRNIASDSIIVTQNSVMGNAAFVTANLTRGEYYIEVEGLHADVNTNYLVFINNIPRYKLSSEFLSLEIAEHITSKVVYVEEVSIAQSEYLHALVHSISEANNAGNALLKIEGITDPSISYTQNSIRGTPISIARRYNAGAYQFEVFATNAAVNANFVLEVTIPTIHAITSTSRTYSEDNTILITDLNYVYFSIDSVTAIPVTITVHNIAKKNEEGNVNAALKNAVNDSQIVSNNSVNGSNIILNRNLAQGVYVVNIFGRSTNIDTSYTLTIDAVITPEIPNTPVFDSSTTNSIVFIVTPVESATSYVWRISEDATVDSSDSTIETLEPRLEIRSLPVSTPRWVAVAAKNFAGTSGYSNSVIGRTTVDTPDTPTFTNRTDSELTFTTGAITGATSYVWRISTDSTVDENDTTMETTLPRLDLNRTICGY